jgi:hypothetical protein
VERKFLTIYGRFRETLNNEGLGYSVRTDTWDKCARTTTFLSNITSIKAKDKCAYQLMFGSKTKLPTSLSIFGDMGGVNTKNDIK